MKRIVWACALLCFATVATAQERPRIVVANYALQYFAERLVGDTAEVDFPVPDGVDPSFWRPSIADISAIQSADLILLNGASFATWVDRVSLPRSKTVNTSSGFEDQFIATESITHSHGDGGEHSHEGTASYVWLDPELAALQATAIASALSTRGIAPASDIEARLASLQADLETLDTGADAAMASAQDDVFIVTHPRYQYLARAYDLTMHALEWEAGATPTASDLAALTALSKETGASILVWEAEPAPEALSATASLGLTNVVFPPLAQRGADFVADFRTAVDAMSKAAATLN